MLGSMVERRRPLDLPILRPTKAAMLGRYADESTARDPGIRAAASNSAVSGHAHTRTAAGYTHLTPKLVWHALNPLGLRLRGAVLFYERLIREQARLSTQGASSKFAFDFPPRGAQ